MPSVDVVTGIVDGAFGNADPGVAFCRNRTVAPELKPDLVPFCAFFNVRQVETENVVSFQNIGIAFPDRCDKIFKQFLFGMVFQADRLFPSGAVGHGNDDDSVFFPLRIREIELRRTERFDIELHPADLRKGHSVEQTHVFRHERLLDHVREQTVRCARRAGIESRHLLQELHGFIVKHKVSERCEELVRIAAFQFRDVYITVHIAQKIRRGHQQERAELFHALFHFIAVADEHCDRAGLRHFQCAEILYLVFRLKHHCSLPMCCRRADRKEVLSFFLP